MTTREKIFETIISVLLICAMAATLGSYTKARSYDRDNIVGLYAEKKNSLDMIYVGGSACYVYWEALRAWENYGYTSYNFAANTLTPQSIKYCIQEALKTQSPKLWVIDLRPFQYGNEKKKNGEVLNMYDEVAIRNVTDNLKHSTLRKELIDISVPAGQGKMEYYFPFLKHHSIAINNLLRDCFHVFTGELNFDDLVFFGFQNKKNTLKGFAFINKTKAMDFTDYSHITETKPLQGVINEYFIDLLDYCKSVSIKPLFVVHSYCQKEEHKQKFNYMKQVIESYGFDFLNTNDYYQEVGLDYSFDLYNENHVNVFGAEKYTDFLSAYIKDRYEMPNHRGDPDYAEWDTCLNEFNARTAQAKREILIYAKESNE